VTIEEAVRLAVECLRAHSIGPAGVYSSAADMLGHAVAQRDALKAALEKLTRAAKNVAHWHWGACRVQVGQACTCTDQIVALRQALDELEEK